MIYALVDSESMVVVNVAEISDEEIEAGFNPGQSTLMIKSEGAVVGDSYNPKSGKFTKPQPPKPDLEKIKVEARARRDHLMSINYDRGTQELRRDIDLCGDPDTLETLREKLMSLHSYAKSLQDIPDQKGFPLNIDWPNEPSI